MNCRSISPALAPGLSALGVLLMLAGCAERQPVLYRNAHYASVGQAAAARDIDRCRDEAQAAGATAGNKTGAVATGTLGGGAIGGAAGAASGAVLGRPGTGAAAGAAGGAAAGLVRALLKRPEPSGAYKGYVNRCLAERGYVVVGWE